MLSVHVSETTFNSMAMDLTEAVQPVESFYLDEENYYGCDAGKMPFTSTPRQRVRGGQSFLLSSHF